MFTLRNSMKSIAWDSVRRKRVPSVIPEEYEVVVEAHKAGDYDLSISLVKELSNWNSDPMAQRLLGHALLGKGMFEDALAAHKKSKSLRCDDEIGSASDEVNQASVYVAMGAYEEAWLAHERALSHYPEFTPAILGKIAVLNRQGQTGQLRDYIRDILDKDPDFYRREDFQDHLKNDSDFMRVADIINSEIGGS